MTCIELHDGVHTSPRQYQWCHWLSHLKGLVISLGVGQCESSITLIRFCSIDRTCTHRASVAHRDVARGSQGAADRWKNVSDQTMWHNLLTAVPKGRCCERQWRHRGPKDWWLLWWKQFCDKNKVGYHLEIEGKRHTGGRVVSTRSAALSPKGGTPIQSQLGGGLPHLLPTGWGGTPPRIKTA